MDYKIPQKREISYYKLCKVLSCASKQFLNEQYCVQIQFSPKKLFFKEFTKKLKTCALKIRHS